MVKVFIIIAIDSGLLKIIINTNNKISNNEQFIFKEGKN